MKNKELFDRTIGILVKAYFENTLEHSNCYACAVGNIVAANCGYSFVKGQAFNEKYYTGLGTLTYSPPLKFEDQLVGYLCNDQMITKQVASQVIATGYSFIELQQIEIAFESVSNRGDEDKYMLDGLMAVCDTLMQIHEATAEETESAKLQFVR